MHLVYINLSIGSVFDSQVVSLLKHFIRINLIPSVTLMCGIHNEEEKQIVVDKFKGFNIELLFFKVYPNYSFTNAIQEKAIINTLRKTNLTSKTVFHLRGELLSLYLSDYFKKLGNNVVVDIRGAAYEEINEFQNKNIVTRFKLNNIKRSLKGLQNYKHISVVSASLRNYVINRAKVDPAKISIIPCIAGDIFKYGLTKTKIREGLSIRAEDFLVAFSSGGMAVWQNFKVIDELAAKGIWILNLSQVEINNPKVINKFIKHSEMPQYLSACDAGIMIRNESIVNKVACPVKFVEYVCCGIPVIANHSVDSVNEYIQQTGYGAILKTIDDLKTENLISLRQLSPTKISTDGIDRFGIQKASESYLKIYNS